ncbi:kinesin-domain-containing protein [Neoconidiobolus thromboides FSU 785]|nr:kinesin-domain-containing protein [Neoconidiobolus thromboides FSU 785]
MSAALLSLLLENGLEGVYSNLLNAGAIEPEDLLKISMTDYDRLGISGSREKRSMLNLVQRIRNSRSSETKTTPRKTGSSSTGTKPIQQKASSGPKSHNRSMNLREVKSTQKPVEKGYALDAYGIPIKERKSIGKLTSRLSQDLAEKIRVCVRKRPLNSREVNRKDSDIVHIINRRALTLMEPKVKVDLTGYIDKHKFIFDETFDCDADNDHVYNRTAKPLVNHVFNGGNATCFAYGQTGSGKTFTMLDELTGLYVRAAGDMIALLKEHKIRDKRIYVSFYEIYQGQLYDLLSSRKKLVARENEKQQIVIQGLREIEIRTVENLLEVYEYGKGARTTGSTGANSDSSRSHAILELSYRLKDRPNVVNGKFTFIDLAGSERGADRGLVDNKTRMEGAEINKSLLALKECIRALDQSKQHLPFRQSKLTMVLKDSFVGESKTCMIATISPNSKNCEHTLNTLRYADRVKELRGETINDEPYDEEIEEGEEESIEGECEESMEEEVAYEGDEADFIGNETLNYNQEEYSELDNHLSQPNSKAIIDIPQRAHYHPDPDVLSQLGGFNGVYSNQIIERIFSLHRSQIYSVTEVSRGESLILEDLNSNVLANRNLSQQEKDKLFINYLNQLDDYLERKLVVIEDLKDFIAKYMP